MADTQSSQNTRNTIDTDSELTINMNKDHDRHTELTKLNTRKTKDMHREHIEHSEHS